MRPAAIIVCGGQSSRMGVPKADLPIDGEPLLLRTIRTASIVASPIIVAAGTEQAIPPLPDGTIVARDPAPFRGPLAAFAAALAAIPARCEWTFLLAGDLPFLSADFLRLLDGLRTGDAVVPADGERWHPLAALYRRTVLPKAERLVASNRRRMLDLLDELSVRAVREADWLPCDPHSRCLRNVNTPADYANALRVLGGRDTVTPP